MRYRSQPPITAAVKPEPFMVETRAPQRESKIESEILVPLFAAVISALVVMLVAVIGAVVLDWPLKSVPVAGGATLLLMWAWRGVVRSEALLWTRETITQRDINRDGAVGKPHDVTLLDMRNWSPPPRAPIPEGASLYAETDTKRALIAFVMSCYTFRTPTHAGTSERAHGIRPWQRSRYKDFRDALIRLGIADWQDKDNRRLGWELVVEQDVALGLIAEHVL